MARDMREKFEGEGTLLDPIPGQAHWQIGNIERLIQSVKFVADKVARDHPDATNHECLYRALAAYNEFDRWRGFSPLQMGLGRAPSLDGSLTDGVGDNVPLVESESADNLFGRNFNLMRCAQENFLQWA